MLACGEGSYGRLGQGNSDDLHVLTVISALQGKATLNLKWLETDLTVCIYWNSSQFGEPMGVYLCTALISTFLKLFHK